MAADVRLLALDALETTKDLSLAVAPAARRAVTVEKPWVRRARHALLDPPTTVFDRLDLPAVLLDDALLDREFLETDRDPLLTPGAPPGSPRPPSPRPGRGLERNGGTPGALDPLPSRS